MTAALMTVEPMASMLVTSTLFTSVIFTSVIFTSALFTSMFTTIVMAAPHSQRQALQSGHD
jgi:positive regulator of sigma E activity